MATNHANPAIRYVRTVATADCADLPDRELLDRVAARRDEVAFAAIVRRYGPMVLRVCRNVLRHEQDSEDAFQATFLALARQVATLCPRPSLCGWLHSVAHRVAQKARVNAARRRRHEALAPVGRVIEPADQLTV